MPRHLHVDPFGALSGETFVAGLLSLGAPLEPLQEALGRLRFPGVRGLVLAPEEVVRDDARAFTVAIGADPLPESAPIPYAGVKAGLEGALPPGRARERARRALEALAGATAGPARPTVEATGFEGSALADVAALVVAAAALEVLAVESLTCAPLPVPLAAVSSAGATLDLLKGRPVAGVAAHPEGVTAAGVALVTAWAASAPLPPMTLVAWGAGLRAPVSAGPADGLRLLLGELEPAEEPDRLVVLETNLDDLSAEIVATLPEVCFEAGALDCWLVPALMKKGRPAQVLHALCVEEKRRAVEDALFRHSSTLGVRRHRVERTALERDWETVETRWGRVRVKVARRGGEVVNRAPEFEDCRAISAGAAVPLKEVYAEALAAALRS